MDKPVMIFGNGSLTKAAIEIFKSNNIEVLGILDDQSDSHGTEVMEISVMGKTTDDGYLKFIGKKSEAFIALDDNALRKNTVSMLLKKRKTMPVNAVHSKSYISDNAFIGHGNFINIGATLGAGAEIKNHTILHANATIDHGAIVEDFVQVGAGAVVGSGAHIEESAFIGSGAIVVSGVTVGKNARIGAGSVVIGNVGSGETVFGNPAEKIKK